MKNPLRWFQPATEKLRPEVANTTRHETGCAETGPKNQKMIGAGGGFAMSSSPYARWSRPDYASLARVGFMQNPVVHRCVRLIAENTASIPLVLTNERDELAEHPLLNLLRRPNPMQSGREWVETMVGHLLVSGNAYLRRIDGVEAPGELHLLRPDRVRVLTDREGWVNGYEYTTGISKEVLKPDEMGSMPVFHLAQFHPLDDVCGFPPLQAALMALDIHNAASRWNKGLLDNSARPSGALVYEAKEGGNLTGEQFDRLRAELEDGYTGAARAGRPLLLEGGLDWKAMGYSPRDMDFVSARNAAARDIALTFGVPPMLLGIPGDNTYSNYQEANRAFVRQTLLPLASRIVDGLNHWLSPLYDDAPLLTVDHDRIDGLSGEREALWRRLNEASFLTRAEKRRAVGYPPDDLSQDETSTTPDRDPFDQGGQP
ncbi:MAG: phage portal protein [Pseudomonadota bacterium]